MENYKTGWVIAWINKKLLRIPALKLNLKWNFITFRAYQFQSFVLEKSNTKVIEISSTLIIEKHEIFASSKDGTENSSTCIEKVT